MLIKKSVRHAKVKSLTSEGEKAITRAFMYKIKGHEGVFIHAETIFLSDSNELDDTCIRSVGNKFVYRRSISMRYNTIREIILQLFEDN